MWGLGFNIELGGCEARLEQRFFERRPLNTLDRLDYLRRLHRQACMRHAWDLCDLPVHVVNQDLPNSPRLPHGPHGDLSNDPDTSTR